MLSPVPIDPPIEFDAALYWLDGHFLFRRREGQGFSSKFVTAPDLVAAFTATEQDSGWIPAGVIRTGYNAHGKWYVYSAPAQKVDIIISPAEQLTIPIPRTVLLGMGTSFYLWALSSKNFSANDGAYQAPFPNVHPDGRICWGQNAAPQADPRSARSTWEMFFRTPFNADLANGKSKVHRQDVRLHLRELAESGAKNYPSGDLMPVNCTIESKILAVLGI